ncbi:hypothetical protein [Yinghuangia sp. YIM S09857]|uniref:hypothetical protein n=1 Tax=Yinghuangia sp. YIM S09857 TaxID=3436929 RepID=UPI003F53BA0C
MAKKAKRIYLGRFFLGTVVTPGRDDARDAERAMDAHEREERRRDRDREGKRD